MSRVTATDTARLRVRPIGLRDANRFVADHHRHHGPVRGHKFAVAVADQDGVVRGVAIAGRPVARRLDTGWRLEVLRVATDGTPNACSILYGAVARAGAAIGYRRQDILTYTLATENGASLRAAGWVPVAAVDGASWDRPSRRRTDKHPTGDQIRWHAGPPSCAADGSIEESAA
ncbi:MAG: XF1762 family protein [Acidimicrobiales bacterium]